MKQRRDRRRDRQRAGVRPPPADRTTAPPAITDVVTAAVLATRQGHPHAGALIDVLAERATEAGPALDRALDAAVDRLWSRGWGPADAVHLAEHTLSDAHGAVVVMAAIRDGHRRRRSGERLHPRWVRQLEALEERAGLPAAETGAPHVMVTVLALLQDAPRIPPCVPAPGTRWQDQATVPPGLDERVLARVRALLRKAESTEYAEEAEALTVKAQEMIARHAIEDALLGDAGEQADAPSARRLPVRDPYAHPKALLLSLVADANRCRATWTSDLGWSTVHGFEGDLDAVELLHESLLAQATTAMYRLGAHRDARGRSRTTSFRRSFLLGFAHQIGERLQHAADVQVSAADQRSGGALVPVLTARADRVRAAQQAAFPQAQERASSSSNRAGWAAGRTAGQLALLDPSAGALEESQVG